MKGHPQTSMAGVEAMWKARRRHPRVKLGDMFGPRKVTRLIGRGPRGRSDERVEWQCECGRRGESYVFNLRTTKPHCTHAAEPDRCTRCGLIRPEGLRVRRYCTDGAPCVYYDGKAVPSEGDPR